MQTRHTTATERPLRFQADEWSKRQASRQPFPASASWEPLTLTGVDYVLRLSVKSRRAPVVGLARANGGRRNCGGGENSDERREDTLRQHDAVGSRSRVRNVERQELVGVSNVMSMGT